MSIIFEENVPLVKTQRVKPTKTEVFSPELKEALEKLVGVEKGKAGPSLFIPKETASPQIIKNVLKTVVLENSEKFITRKVFGDNKAFTGVRIWKELIVTKENLTPANEG